jgi:hypothetical protein
MTGQMKRVPHLIINLHRQLSHESVQTDSTIFGCHAEKTLPTSAESTKCFLNFSRTHSPNSQIPASCRAVICEKIMNKSHTPTPPPLATPSRSKSHPGLTKTPKHDIYNRFKSALLVSNNHLNHLSLQIEDQSPSSPSL